jgi:hypothetical protein
MAPKGSFQFSFPAKHHLSVVTERNVLAWNATGIRKTFTSGSNGILAAKETRNGSGTLAVSDSHVVFLHQVEQGMGKSYRLKGADVSLSHVFSKFPKLIDILLLPRVRYACCSFLLTPIFYFSVRACLIRCNRILSAKPVFSAQDLPIQLRLQLSQSLLRLI